MPKYCPANERIKREYFIYLKEAMGQSEASLDSVAGAIARFEAHTGHRDFKTFHQQQAVSFKRKLAEQNSAVTGKKLSKSTLYSTTSHLTRFFRWLAREAGYKSRFTYNDASYFNVSEKDARIATARRHKAVPTLEQVRHLIATMPVATELDQRNRALVAFILLTGARDSAVASAKLKHVDLAAGCFYQDARDVNTKFSKTFTTYFFRVGDDIRSILVAWLDHLRRENLWGNEDPIFPKTRCTLGKTNQFEHSELTREHWATATPIRLIFQRACRAAGLPYFNPHSIRNTLVMIGSRNCKDPEQFKSWSQNLGHDGVLTTLTSYGTVSDMRQGEIIQGMVLPDSKL